MHNDAFWAFMLKPTHPKPPCLEKNIRIYVWNKMLSAKCVPLISILLWHGRNLLTKMGLVKLILVDRGHRGVSGARNSAESQPKMSVTHIDLWMLCSWFYPVVLCRETLESQALLMENNISRWACHVPSAARLLVPCKKKKKKAKQRNIRWSRQRSVHQLRRRSFPSTCENAIVGAFAQLKATCSNHVWRRPDTAVLTCTLQHWITRG